MIEYLNYIPKVAPLVTAVAAIWGVIIATKGLYKWKSETVGKRKLELAEELIVAFFEIGDMLAGVRFPGSFANEGQTLLRKEGETDDDYRARSVYYVAAERILSNANRFAELHAKKHLAIAYFGKSAAAPFDTILMAKNKILLASRNLSQTPEHLQEPASFWEKQREIIGWGMADNDVLGKDIEAAVEQAEQIFGAPLRNATV